MANYIGEIILVGFNFAPTNFAFCDGQLLPIAEHEALFNLIGTTYGGDGETTFALPDLRGRIPIGTGQGAGTSSYQIGEYSGQETANLTLSQLPAHTHAIDISGVTATLQCRNGVPSQSSAVGAVFAVESTAAPFTDPTLTAGVTPPKTTHISELRNAVNGLRARFGLGAFTFANASLVAGTTIIRGQHIEELRTALAQVYTAAGADQPNYTDPTITGNTPIRALHISQLRQAVVAIGGALALPYTSLAPDVNMALNTIPITGTPTAAAAGNGLAHSNMQPYLALNYCIALEGVFPSQS